MVDRGLCNLVTGGSGNMVAEYTIYDRDSGAYLGQRITRYRSWEEFLQDTGFSAIAEAEAFPEAFAHVPETALEQWDKDRNL